MTRRVVCTAAPGPLEEYAARFDDLFTRVAQRRGFREYLAGLLAPRDRNKTLTALAGAEPVAGAQHPAVQRLQFFLSESRCEMAFPFAELTRPLSAESWSRRSSGVGDYRHLSPGEMRLRVRLRAGCRARLGG